MTRRSLPRAGLVLLAWALAPDAGHAMATEVPPLDGTNWVLDDLPGHALLPKVTVTAQFAAGRIAGSDGCNRYAGAYVAHGHDLAIPASLAGTQMACAPEVMEQARAYTTALAAAKAWQIVDGKLELRGDGGRVLARFSTQSRDLSGTSWRVTGINNGRQAVVSVLKDTQVTLQFDREGRVAGSAGCNRYTAGYTVEGTSLRIGQAAVTRMACARPDGAMAQEQQFLAALATMATARIEGDRLELRTSDGALALGATRAD